MKNKEKKAEKKGEDKVGQGQEKDVRSLTLIIPEKDSRESKKDV